MFVDSSHKLENISKRTQLQYKSNIIGSLYNLKESDDTGVFEFRQNKLFNNSFMHSAHFI